MDRATGTMWLLMTWNRGDDPEQLPAIYAAMINAAVADIPDDMAITMHLCRGNFQSTFVASGGYEPVEVIRLLDGLVELRGRIAP